MELDLQANVTCLFCKSWTNTSLCIFSDVDHCVFIAKYALFVPQIKSFASIGSVAIFVRHIPISYDENTFCSLTRPK